MTTASTPSGKGPQRKPKATPTTRSAPASRPHQSPATGSAVPHFLGLTGATAIPTQQFQMGQLLVQAICRKDSIGVLHGDAGYGKTFTMRNAIEQVTDREVVVLEFPPEASSRQVAGSLVKSLTGVDLSCERRIIIDAAADALREKRRLLVIDEAQRLTHKPIELLRHFHDDRGGKFGLLLVGGNECWKVLSRYPMLKSRIHHRVEFHRMDPDEVVAMMRAFHPVWEGADTSLIDEIDERHCRGVWRRWTGFTATLIDLAEQMGKKPLDREVVDLTFVMAP